MSVFSPILATFTLWQDHPTSRPHYDKIIHQVGLIIRTSWLSQYQESASLYGCHLKGRPHYERISYPHFIRLNHPYSRIIPQVCHSVNRIVFVFGDIVQFPLHDVTKTTLSPSGTGLFSRLSPSFFLLLVLLFNISCSLSCFKNSYAFARGQNIK